MQLSKIEQNRNRTQLYKPGVSGNPSGRPKGVKNRTTILREELLNSLLEDSTETAFAFFQKLKKQDRRTYATLLAKLLPTPREDTGSGVARAAVVIVQTGPMTQDRIDDARAIVVEAG